VYKTGNNIPGFILLGAGIPFILLVGCFLTKLFYGKKSLKKQKLRIEDETPQVVFDSN
jgi:hypothetical protein